MLWLKPLLPSHFLHVLNKTEIFYSKPSVPPNWKYFVHIYQPLMSYDSSSQSFWDCNTKAFKANQAHQVFFDTTLHFASLLFTLEKQDSKYIMAFKTSKLAHFNINSPWLCHVYSFLKREPWNWSLWGSQKNNLATPTPPCQQFGDGQYS